MFSNESESAFDVEPGDLHRGLARIGQKLYIGKIKLTAGAKRLVDGALCDLASESLDESHELHVHCRRERLVALFDLLEQYPVY